MPAPPESAPIPEGSIKNAMKALGLKADAIFQLRGYKIEDILVYLDRRIWQVYPQIAPPRDGRVKVWGALVGQTVVIDGQTCGCSSLHFLANVHFLATVMHKAMQAAAGRNLETLSRNRAFDAVCTVGVCVLLEQWVNTREKAISKVNTCALEEQRRIAVSLLASVTESDFLEALRRAYPTTLGPHAEGQFLARFRNIRNMGRP